MEGSIARSGSAIDLIGGLAVRIGSVDVTRALGGKVGQLAFAYLALHRDRAVRRDELAGAIWEEQSPANVDAALRVVLSRLRSALGRDMLTGRAELRLELPEPVAVDLERLRETVGAAERTLEFEIAAQAERQSAHELLPGLEADWLTEPRDELRELRLRALAAVGRSALKAGDGALPQALDAARQLIGLAPYRETGHQLRIEALAASGNTAEALRSYEEFRQRLREELGSIPGPELAALHTELLRATDETQRPSGAIEDQLPLPVAATPSGRPGLTGRDAELLRLQASLERARDGRLVHLLVAGEPGIGKSRLAAELARIAHTQGANVLWGRCHEEALIPYEPFVEGLRQYAAALDDDQLAALAHVAGTEFLSLAPELARRLPRAALAPVADDPQARRYRLFESVAEVLRLAAAPRSLVFVLEDLHWGDSGTSLLLTHMVRRSSSAPVLLLGTFRTTDVPDEHPLGTLLPQMDTLELSGLSAQATTELVTELAPGANAAEVHAETEGNPLFIVEALRALLETGEGAARSGRIRDVIGARLQRASADASTMLGVGAVLGRSFAFDDVARISGLDQARLLDAVDEALAARLVEEVPHSPGNLSFTHALIREVRYRQHSSARRMALHDAAAEAIRALHQDQIEERRADLAIHLEACARDRRSGREAVEALRQAGVQAAERQAFEDAVAWFERARALFELARPSEAGRCDVLLELAEALRASDRIAEARAAALEAARLARGLDDGERLARAALVFVGSHLVFKAGRPDAEDITLLEEAISAIPDTHPAKVRLLARLTTAIYYSDRFNEVPARAARSLELARATGSEDALGWAHYARFWAALEPGGAAAGAATAREMAGIAETTASVELVSEVAMVKWYTMLRMGRPDLLAEELDCQRERILGTGIPIFKWFMDAIGAVLAVTFGRFEEAEQRIGELAASGAAIDRHDLPRFATMPMIQLRHHQGRLGELVDPLRIVVENNPGLPVWRGVLLQALTSAGANIEAKALLEELGVEDFAWLRRDVNWLWAMTSIATACAALKDEQTAAVVYELLSGIPEQSVVSGPALGFYGTVRRYLAPLAALIGRADEAEHHFGAAITALEDARALPLAALTRADAAR